MILETRVQTWLCLNLGIQRAIVVAQITELRPGMAKVCRAVEGEASPRPDAPEEEVEVVQIFLAGNPEPVLVEGSFEAVKVKLFGAPVAVKTNERLIHSPHGLAVVRR